MYILKFLSILACLSKTMGGYEEKVASLEIKKRVPRHCPLDVGTDVMSNFHSVGFGMFFLLLGTGILLFLLFLGLVKALLGFYLWASIGRFGMNMLVDLPRPLNNYHEPEIKDLPVIYDVAGWPVHPQTGRRTVRALSRKTEFCMNVIFFISYPVVMVITFCSWCCYRTYDEEGTDNRIYENVNTVVFSECPTKQVDDCKEKSKVCKGSCIPEVYEDGDPAEDEDTQYVLDQLGRSEEGLNRSDQGLDRSDQGYNRNDQAVKCSQQCLNRSQQSVSRSQQGSNRNQQGLKGSSSQMQRK